MINLYYQFLRGVLWLIFRLGFGLEISGRAHLPKRGAFILASNHLSYLDPPLVGVACPRRASFLARADLFAHPVLGWFLRSVRVIPLQRGQADLASVREAVRRLRRGEVVAIFPEGGRQLSGQLGAAKRGVGVLATMARVPIIPVLVEGTFQALPPDARWVRRAKIRVAFGPQILYAEGRFAAEQLAQQITDHWHHLRRELHGTI